MSKVTKELDNAKAFVNKLILRIWRAQPAYRVVARDSAVVWAPGETIVLADAATVVATASFPLINLPKILS